MKWPSFNNSNPLTWRCKLFGCKDELAPAIFYEYGEKHGIQGYSSATAATTCIEISFSGCSWCLNYRRIYSEDKYTFPICDCEICENRIIRKIK
jgi:hypothetical protein